MSTQIAIVTVIAAVSISIPACSLFAQGGNGMDTAGPYRIAPLDASSAKNQQRLRDFIWQHWTAKKEGRVSAEYITVEGGSTKVNYEIRWHEGLEGKILVTYEGSSGGFPGIAPKKHKGHHIATAVKRVAPEAKRARDSSSQTGSYRIRLLGKNGAILEEL